MDAEDEKTSSLSLDFRVDECCPHPLQQAGNMARLNENEFLVPSIATHDGQRGGIYTFNTKRNEWNLFLIYPPALKVSDPSLCFNEQSQTIYLFCSVNKLVKIDLYSKQFDVCIVRGIGYCSCSFVWNNQCHLIGGSPPSATYSEVHSNQHFVWHDEDERVFLMHTFEQFSKGFTGFGCVQFSDTETRDKMYLFGGYDPQQRESCDNIWVWNTQWYEWTVLTDIKLPRAMHAFGYELSADQRYVVLLGGYARSKLNSNPERLSTVYIWDLENMRFYQSDIKVTAGPCYSVSMNNENDVILAMGYIREMSRVLEIEIPGELQWIIMMFFKTEYIHYMNTESRAKKFHHRLDINVILNSSKIEL